MSAHMKGGKAGKSLKRLSRSVREAAYSLYVRIPARKSKGNMRSKKVKDGIFYWSIAIIPLAMLAFNIVFINFNSILLAFKQYDETGTAAFAGFANFVSVFRSLRTDPYMYQSLVNSLIVYAISVVVTAVIPILFSYYLYKKLWLTGLFKVILFLPSIISSVVTVIIFKFIADRVVPSILADWGKDIGVGLLSESSTQFKTILVYTLWMQLGGGMLIQLGAMNSVDKSVVEAGRLDGLSFLGELWHIVLPKSYQVISIGFITGIVSIFTNDFGLYAFYGENASSNVSTLGYYFLVETNRATDAEYPFWAAWGLVASCIAIPLTFFARWAIYKFGPQED